MTFLTARIPATKTVLRPVLIAASMAFGALSLQSALADTPAAGANQSTMPMRGGVCPHAKHGTGGMWGMMGSPEFAKHVDEKLDDLGAKLHLTEKQQPAWKTYRGYITTSVADFQKKHQGMHGTDQMQAFRDLPTPERMQKMADHMKTMAGNLDQLAKKTGAFYKQLTPEQQTIFDMYQREMHGRRFGQQGQHPAGMGMQKTQQ